MVIPNLSLKTWGLIASGLVIAALLLMVNIRTKERDAAISNAAAVQSSFDQTVASYRATRDQARQSDELNRLRVGKQQTNVSQEVQNDYTQRIAALRADFAERVRRATGSDSRSGGAADLSGLSAATGGLAATTCHAEFPAKDALIASEQAEQLIALQSWVKRQHAIDPNGSTE